MANVPCSEILTKDSLTLNIDAVIFFKVIDPLKTMQEVEDYKESTILLGATTLRNTLGQVRGSYESKVMISVSAGNNDFCGYPV